MKKALRPACRPSPWSEWKVSTTGRDSGTEAITDKRAERRTAVDGRPSLAALRLLTMAPDHDATDGKK
jgi:hypothetical protein